MPTHLPRTRQLLLACAISLAAAAAPLAAQTISPVPIYPGGSNSVAYAVNATGSVAAGYSNNSGGVDTALRWTPGGGSANLGFLPFGGTNSYAQAIDASGNNLAGYGDHMGNSRAFRWTNPGGYQVLPLVSGSTTFATARGISAAGNRVVGTSGSGVTARAFLWDAASPSFSLGLGLLSGQSTSGALAISGDGSTVVGTSGPLPFRWTSATSIQGLGSPLPGQTFALAEAVSTNGSVITGRWSNGNEMGYRWTAATGMVALPNLAGGSTLRPRAISGDGNIIIGQGIGNAGLGAFIWTPTTGTYELSTHLSSRGVNLVGWTLTDATGISADGNAMCGTGIYNGQSVGWVVTVPCPTISNYYWYTTPNDCQGSIAVFQGATVGGFGILWQWLKNGVPIVNGLQPSGSNIIGADSITMQILNYSPGDAGTYQLSITAGGTCPSVSGPLNVPGAPAGPTMITQPTPINACAGDFPFLFAAANPAPNTGSANYRWQRYNGVNFVDLADGPSGNGSTLNGTGTTTFSFFSIQPGDIGFYRCRIYDSLCGTASQTFSNFVLVNVNTSTFIQTHPQYTAVCPGDNDAFFSVTAGPVNATLNYQWQKKNAIFFNVYNDIFDGPTGNGGNYGGTQTPNLSVNGVYNGDFEYYRCVVTGPCGPAAVSNDAYLDATPGPFIGSGPTGGAGCPFGVAAMSISAFPAGCTYQWQKYVGPCILCYQNVANGPTGNGGTYSGAQSATLTITGLDLFDTVTTFRCLVTGPCGGQPIASDDWAFSLMDTPALQTQPTGGPVCKNGSKTMSVTLAPGNYGTLSYQWWRYVPAFPIFAQVPNGPLPSGALVSNATTSSITISNFKPQDAGQYYCKVIGDCGVVNSSVVNLTSCPADFNCMNGVTVQDIFDFLAAWFANNPTADFNGVNGVTVQDIFDFLAAWFAGC